MNAAAELDHLFWMGEIKYSQKHLILKMKILQQEIKATGDKLNDSATMAE